MDSRPIGIFDSGIGGLTVLKELVKILPNEDFIYYADTKHIPYGNKSQKQIIEYSKNIVEFLISKNVKAIVIACGTASSLAYLYLKEHYNIPIFNIIKPIAQSIKDKNIGIIATKSSVASHVWENEISKYNSDINIHLVACPALVPLAEKGLQNTFISKQYIKHYLKKFKDENITSLILGCTHYPIFYNQIAKELGSNINIINVGTPLAIDFKKFLTDSSLLANNTGNITYIASGNYNIFINKFKKME